MTAGGAGGAAAAAAIARAIKASGVLVRVEPQEFRKIVDRAVEALVVIAPPAFLSKKRTYLTSYRGLAFHTKTAEDLLFGSRVEIVACEKIWIPG